MINPIEYCREHGIDMNAFIKAANAQKFTRFGKIQVMMASNEAYGLQLREEVEDILLDMNDSVPAPPAPKENRSRRMQGSLPSQDHTRNTPFSRQWKRP